MTTWHVWTDGSCHPAETGRGWGGWAAVVEHGSDGYVLRGRVPETTNVRMELVAAIEGLASIPLGERVVLHTDATTILSVEHRRRHGGIGGKGKDVDLWRDLAVQLDRLYVRVELLGRGVRDPIHKRAHSIAGAEAKGGVRGLPNNATPDDQRERRREKRRKKRARATALRPRGGLRHHGNCEPGRCVVACAIWRDEHPEHAAWAT